MTFDYDLTFHDVQQLSNADSLEGFLSRLGYNTNSRIEQTSGNLGISAEGTLRPIRRIELLADQEKLLQVYLFELSSVTVSHARSLARHFRNRAGNYLLILTSDYERIDFVLLEKFVPSSSGSARSISTPQVGVRPRTLTLERRKPSRVHLRVLRRFTYTESDPFAQYDKLISAFAIADWSEEFFNNRALFSDYYLLERLREFPEWSEDPKPAFRELNTLFLEKASDLRGKKKEVLRLELFEPILKTLGFSYQTGRKAGSDLSEPDYRLFAASNERQPLVFALVYPWARSLDGKDSEEKRDKESPEENPGAVVVGLLEKGEAPWAIVTNGKLWRLYSQHTHSKATNYYEIDLEEVLAQGGQKTGDPAEAFRYFWLFFRQKAFQSVPVTIEGREKKQSFLDRLLSESKEYAKELGERLKERVFEKIFPHLAEGFITGIRAEEGKDAELSQERLDKVFQGTLTLLYRLLFILYAEARNLLPVKETRGYYEASLMKLKKEVAEAAGTIADDAETKLARSYSKDQFSLYERLCRLFQVIDAGDAGLNVPMYNGGLFLSTVPEKDSSPEAENARFLNANKIPDLFLAKAINLLTRDIDPNRHDLVMIDFKSLGVRQLGSIYEGLLEFKLRIAPEKMAYVKGKKTEEIILYREAQKDNRKILTTGRARTAPERTLPKGAVYLENDKHERKATGSYYTPDHIVEYIVENAVGPALREKFDSLRPKIREAQHAYREAVKRKQAFEKQKMKGDDPEKVAFTYRRLVDELFSIKVLDPAMGSGHFLVEAVDFITDKAIDFLNAFPWNPVFSHLQDTRQTILKEMDGQGITIDPGRLTDVNLLKRHILKRCIYGMDINPMAVELAKVSLWLDCFTLGAPLSFLDHHMKCGNSLIGTSVEEAQRAIEKGQPLLFGGNQFAGLMLATDLMRHVGELSDVTSDQVQQSKTEFKKASDALAPYKRILDVYTSQWFGNPERKAGKGKSAQWINPAINFLNSQEAESWSRKGDCLEILSEEYRNVVSSSMQDVTVNRFFHWELEFPEVFYGPRQGTTQAIGRLEDGGFDAVVGNPPYARVQTLQQNQSHAMDYLKAHYISAYGSFDIYVNFIEKGYQLLNPNGIFGKILPHKFFQAQFAEPIRKFLAKEKAIRQIVRFGAEQVFEEASTYTCLLFLSKKAEDQFRIVDVKDLTIPGELFTALRFGDSSPGYQLETIPAPHDANWDFSVGGVRKVLDKLHQQSLTLGDITRKIFQGIATSADKIYVLKKLRESKGILSCYSKALSREIKIEQGLVKPFLMGKDVHRYAPPNPENVVIFPYTLQNGRAELMTQSFIRENFPNGWEYLLENKKALSEREKGKMRGERFYAYIYPKNLTEFEAVKIMTAEIAFGCQMTLDTKGNCYHTTKAYSFVFNDGLSESPWYFLGILNSKLLWFFLSATGYVLRGGYFTFKTQYLSPFPIACSLSKNPPSRRQEEKISELVCQLLEARQGNPECDVSSHERAIDQLVYTLYDLTPEEIRIVEEYCKS